MPNGLRAGVQKFSKNLETISNSGHAGLRGNDKADYLARTAASYSTTIAYNAIPIHRGKQLLKEYYIKIWNATYINTVSALW
jgi:hypothetical protein